MKIIVVSFFPGNGSQEAVGGFDWYPDTIAGGVAARTRTFSLMTNLDTGMLSETSVTVCRLEVPVDPESKGWQMQVTRWLDENAHLRELPDQSAKPGRAARDAHPDGSTVTLWTTGVIPPDGDWKNTDFWIEEEAARGNAECGGHDLIRVTAVVTAAEVTQVCSSLRRAEANARRDYRTFLGREIVVDDLLAVAGGFDDLPGKFRVRVCPTGDDDIARVMDDYVDPIWNVELLEVLEGDQKTAWRAENLCYHAPSYVVKTGNLSNSNSQEHFKLMQQLTEKT